MKLPRFLFISLCFFLLGRVGFGQFSQPAVPFSISSNLKPIETYENLTSFNQTKASQDSIFYKSRLKFRKFAQMLNVNFHPYQSGQWDNTSSGRTWRIGICSKKAYSLYLVFGQYQLKPGVKLFVYNPCKTTTLGAFSAKNNNKSNRLSVAPLEGDSLILELNIPEGITDFGELVLSQVGHDFINEFGKTKLGQSSLETSDTCMVDVNCTIGTNWQNEKRAVCKLIANGFLCTGTMINTTDGKTNRYLLTAHHCIDTFDVAASAIYFFNYENKTCNRVSKSNAVSISGSELLATTSNKLDFTLVKLNQTPPIMWKPYLAGWDASSDAPQSAVCIHHPNGDVKKISMDNSPLVTASFGEDFNNNAHWLVTHWDVGSTQGGSSGSPIFNNMHRICGTLTGGEATCAFPYNDYFNKFSLSWNYYSDSSNQLKYWLDPKNTNASVIDGREMYPLDSLSFDTLSNTTGETLSLSSNNLTWGYVTGQNSAGYSQFAEKYACSNECLVDGMFLHVAKNFYASPYSYITLKVWTGTSYPQNEIYSQSIYLNTLNEKSTNFEYFDSLVSVADTFFVGYEVNYQSPMDTFAVYHANNRSLPQLSHTFVYDGIWNNMNEVTHPTLNTSLDIGPIICSGTPFKTNQELTLYPNPCSGIATIQLPNNIIVKYLECVDLTGRHINPAYERVGSLIYVNTASLPSGVILVSIVTQLSRFSKKLIVLKN